MKKHKSEIKVKLKNSKSISINKKIYPRKSCSGKQGSIRSGGGKRN